ncbi:30S ribosomal protein S5 [Patescibacteria group bacterium]|nr:30S ribosomal protein S5 [Patescibacteria group bacterium]MBU0879295.1 30S ribosomal protein S5 [Patescibacteria group bacterium]MBU0880261.1 30S ribosomal protein S5 [Patescibacteria group bacterium]MBU0898140.1 30S ribosomal protein S5 [Patescibacteria group bacterium]MBU1783397.1 30S ribosomal protein S5 [Patescibacteria group bacterium]
MVEAKKQNNQISNKTNSVATNNNQRQAGRGGNSRGFAGRGRGGAGRGEEKQDEFEQKVIDLARVTRVMAGGKRMRFRACIAIGNKKGRVAIGLAKGADVTIAVTKAVNKAKKNFVDVPIVNDTIPHEIRQKYGAARILFRPAKMGRGIIAGGAVRIILELTGIKNVTSKILGTNNKMNNVKCTILALQNLQRPEIKKKINSRTELTEKNSLVEDKIN